MRLRLRRSRPLLILHSEDWFICSCGSLVFTRLADDHAIIVHHTPGTE